jgi:uncharacterized protein YeaO (DUF488 family)
MTFQIKRVYEPVASNDGQRVLVDRLWPRGLTKADAKLSLWLKEVAPSPALRSWFGHEPARFDEFGRRYKKELTAAREPLTQLGWLGREHVVTLLYAARDPQVNHAKVLLSVLLRSRPSWPPDPDSSADR